MKTQSLDLITSYIENPAIEELFEVAAKFNDDTALERVKHLLKIRSPETDDLLTESLRMMGVNLDREILAQRLSELASVYETLPEWRQVNGTVWWTNYVSMLLGTDFQTQRLWTADYETFYPTPQGILLKKGGDWYKTSHVSLDVDARLEAQLNLVIRNKDVRPLVQAITQLGISEQDAQDWVYGAIGTVPGSSTPLKAQVRSTLLMLRISEIFYEYAPIEEVLERVSTTLNLGLHLCVTAHTVVESVRRFVVGSPIRTAVRFDVPPYIQGGSITRIPAVVTYSDGLVVSEPAHIESDDIIERMDEEAVRFRDPSGAQTTKIRLTWDTHSLETEAKLFPQGLTPDPEKIEIWHPVMYGSSEAVLRVYGYFNGSKRDITDSGQIFITSSLGTVVGNRIIFPAVVEDTQIKIRCVYSGLRDIPQEVNPVVKRSVMQRIPVSLSIQAPDEIKQGEPLTLVTYVKYNDGITEIADPIYKTTSRNTAIVGDTLRSSVLASDFMTTITAEFGYPDAVTSTVELKLLAPRTLLAVVDIILPNVVEKMFVTPKAMGLYVKEGATPQQISDRDPAIVVAYQPVRGQWFTSQLPNSNPLPDVRPSDGLFQAPVVAANVLHNISINVIDNQMTRTFTQHFDVFPFKYIPQEVDINHGRSISNGSSINLPTVCLFNTGQTFAAAASMRVEFIPSQSAIEEARSRTIALQEEAIKTGGDPTQFDPDNPDYSRWVFLDITDSRSTLHDPMLNRDQPLKQLYFKGDLHGAARIYIEYEYDGTEVTNYRDFQLVPVRALVSGLSIQVPDILFENSRTFAQISATYDDGTQDYVDASWSGDWATKSFDDYELIRFHTGKHRGMDIVVAVEGREPATYSEFRQMPVSKLPVFAQVRTLQQLREQLFTGAIVDVGKLSSDMDEAATIIAQHFREETYLPITITLRPSESLNNVVSSRIIGALSISSDIRVSSYALAVTYATNGIQKQVDGSYRDVPVKEFEQEMTCDWTVLNQYLIEDTPDGRVMTPIDYDIVSLDDIGDMTVLDNINGAVRIQATYTCDNQNVIQQALITINKANTWLDEIRILGQDVVNAEMLKNPAFETEGQTWYIPYTARVIYADGTEALETDCLWRLGTETTVGASIDGRGRLFLPEGQVSDGHIQIECEFVSRDPRSGQMETIVGRRTITFQSDNAIVKISVNVPDSNIEPLNEYQAEVHYERRNTMTGSNLVPDADSVKFTWSVVENVSGFTISPSGVFRFESDSQPQTAIVRCTVTEQRTRISRDLSITCLGVGYPQDLTISSFTNIRDRSEIDCVAMLGRSGTFGKEDVSSQVMWQLVNARGDVVSVPGVSISNTGKLSVGSIHDDIRFGVRAVYVEGRARLIQTRYINAYTSYPRFGTAVFGVNSVQLVEQNLTDRLRTTTGGSFMFSPAVDEFGYFAIHGSYGQAVFGFGSDSSGNINKGWIAMDGANWDVTGDNGTTGAMVLRKVYDNVIEDLLLYRTNARAFGTSVLTVRFV